MYQITVTWLEGERPDEVHGPAEEYEVKNGVLTVAIDRDHDVVIPLYHVKSVDIVRHRAAGEWHETEAGRQPTA
jgi:hypothetical protein